MSNSLTLFDINGEGLRFGATKDGTPYAVASDFAKSMGYRDAHDATRLLDDEEKGTQIVRTPGGDQEMSVIYRDGLWELIFRSNLPGAKAIKKRVKEILREIEQTGSYSVAPRNQFDILRAAIDEIQATSERMAAVEIRQTALEQRQEILEENHERYAAIGYANLRKIPSDVRFLNQLGRRASRIAERDGVEVSRVHSTIWGEVNAWPLEVWDEAYAGLS